MPERIYYQDFYELTTKLKNSHIKYDLEKIEKAYIELLQEKERANINISLICEKAEVNRSTFYANFMDLYDLERSIKEKLLTKFCEVYNDKIKMRGEFSDFLNLFYHIKDNEEGILHCL